MKYFIYIAIAALAVWAVIYVIRHVARQARGECSCGEHGACTGNCSGCSHHCSGKHRAG